MNREPYSERRLRVLTGQTGFSPAYVERRARRTRLIWAYLGRRGRRYTAHKRYRPEHTALIRRRVSLHR